MMQGTESGLLADASWNRGDAETGFDVTDKAKERDGVVCYGAIGVGGTKMKIHRAAVARLFESNDQVLDAEEVYALGEGL